MLSHRVSNVKYIFRTFSRTLNTSSNVYVQKQDVIQSEKETKTNIPIEEQGHFEQIRTSFKKSAAKLPAHEPIAKNFFCGKADPELLAYLEPISREDMPIVQTDCDVTKAYFETIRSDSVDREIFEELKKLKSFGVNVAHEHGGRGYNFTECCLNGEIEGIDSNLAVTLNAHHLVTRIIMECGTEDQQKIYLPRLAKGELIGTVAFFENELSPKGFFNTTAKLSANEESYRIDGKKSLVINGSNANLFLIIAESQTKDRLGDSEIAITAFLVDASTPGIHLEPKDSTLGLRGVAQHSIVFDNCEVPLENIIGGPHKGNIVAQKMLINARLQSSLLSVVMAKRIIQKLTEFCINNTQFNIKLMDTELHKKKLADAVCSTYALESMIYYTTGLMDTYENQDVDVETAIIKTFAQQSLIKMITSAYDLMGPKALISNDPIDVYLRDALHLYANNETKDSLDLFIGFAGLQHAGVTMNAEVKKIRNPLFNPSFIFKKFLSESANLIENPTIVWNLSHNLHPSLDTPGKWLDQSVSRLKVAVEVCFSRHGQDILQRHTEVLRISSAAILIYAMFTSLARASRSYCIGLQHSEHEIRTASTFSFNAMNEIKKHVIDVNNGPLFNSDVNCNLIAEQLFKSKGYFPVHPLTRNF